MLRIAASLGAALLLGTAACTFDNDVSQSSIERGINYDIDQARGPATTNDRLVMPSAKPPIANGGEAPASPITMP
jgi:hypothetical protein